MSDLPKKGGDPHVHIILDDHERRLQNPTHKTSTTAPQTQDVPEGGFVISTVAGNTFIYTKHLGVVKKVQVT